MSSALRTLYSAWRRIRFFASQDLRADARGISFGCPLVHWCAIGCPLVSTFQKWRLGSYSWPNNRNNPLTRTVPRRISKKRTVLSHRSSGNFDLLVFFLVEAMKWAYSIFRTGLESVAWTPTCKPTLEEVRFPFLIGTSRESCDWGWDSLGCGAGEVRGVLADRIEGLAPTALGLMYNGLRIPWSWTGAVACNPEGPGWKGSPAGSLANLGCKRSAAGRQAGSGAKRWVSTGVSMVGSGPNSGKLSSSVWSGSPRWASLIKSSMKL